MAGSFQKLTWQFKNVWKIAERAYGNYTRYTRFRAKNKLTVQSLKFEISDYGGK